MILILFALLIVQYFASRASLNTLVLVFHSFLPRPIVFALISLIFFPGTVIHELAHAITAVCLLLPVHSIHLIPEWDNHSIKLGHVSYEKRDIWRGILVGIAPLPFGLFVLWWILQFHWPVVITAYLIFVITSTMFSSKSDLVDVIYIIPLAIVIFIVWVAFPTVVAAPVLWLARNKEFVTTTTAFINTLTIYVGVSIAVHVGIILLGKILGIFTRR